MKFRKIKLISDGLGSNGREWMRGNVWEGMVGREWTWREKIGGNGFGDTEGLVLWRRI